MLKELSQFISAEILKQPDRILAPSEPLISSGIIDSFSLMDLALFVEDTYGVQIKDTELNSDTIDTLQTLVSIIQSRR